MSAGSAEQRAAGEKLLQKFQLIAGCRGREPPTGPGEVGTRYSENSVAIMSTLTMLASSSVIPGRNSNSWPVSMLRIAAVAEPCRPSTKSVTAGPNGETGGVVTAVVVVDACAGGSRLEAATALRRFALVALPLGVTWALTWKSWRNPVLDWVSESHETNPTITTTTATELRRRLRLLAISRLPLWPGPWGRGRVASSSLPVKRSGEGSDNLNESKHPR
jgi:hypothetical protein